MQSCAVYFSRQQHPFFLTSPAINDHHFIESTEIKKSRACGCRQACEPAGKLDLVTLVNSKSEISGTLLYSV
jgi:hypothetical protein